MGIKEIAEAAHVSPATVSNILNGRKNVSEETRERILALCRSMNFESASKRSKTKPHMAVPCVHHPYKLLQVKGGDVLKRDRAA